VWPHDQTHIVQNYPSPELLSKSYLACRMCYVFASATSAASKDSHVLEFTSIDPLAVGLVDTTHLSKYFTAICQQELGPPPIDLYAADPNTVYSQHTGCRKLRWKYMISMIKSFDRRNST